MKFREIYLGFIVFGFFIVGCSSGEYDLDEYTVQYTEKTLKYDTIQVANNENQESEENKELKEEIKSSVSYSYIVQIGAFMIKDNYERFITNAKSVLGDEVYYIYVNELYKIRIGNFDNKTDALNFLYSVRNQGYSDAFIITVRR